MILAAAAAGLHATEVSNLAQTKLDRRAYLLLRRRCAVANRLRLQAT